MRIIRRIVTLAYALAASAYYLCRKKISGSSVLIVTPLRLGDFCMWLPFAAALIRHYQQQEYRVTLLLPENLYFFARKHLQFDAVITRKYPEELHSLRQMRNLNAQLSGNFAAAIAVSVERAFFYDDLPRIFTGAKQFYSARAVPLQERFWGKLSLFADKLFFRNATVTLPDHLHTPELLNYQRLTEAFCGHAVTPQTFASGTQGGGTVLAPFSQDPSRSYPAEKFAAVLPEMIAPVTLLGTTANIETAKKLCSAAKFRINNLCGMTTLPELTEIIAQCSIIIGTDSGIANLGIIYGKKVIAVTGQANQRFICIPQGFEQYGFQPPVKITAKKRCPLAGCNYHCPFKVKGKTYPCINEISAGNIIDVITGLKPLETGK